MYDELLDDDLEESYWRRTGLWLFCLFIMAAIIIGGIILILWTCGVL